MLNRLFDKWGRGVCKTQAAIFCWISIEGSDHVTISEFFLRIIWTVVPFTFPSAAFSNLVCSLVTFTQNYSGFDWVHSSLKLQTCSGFIQAEVKEKGAMKVMILVRRSRMCHTENRNIAIVVAFHCNVSRLADGKMFQLKTTGRFNFFAILLTWPNSVF